MELRGAPHSPQRREARTRAPQPQQLMSPCLLGEYHLSADMTLGAKRLTLVLGTQSAEVDAADNAARIRTSSIALHHLASQGNDN